MNGVAGWLGERWGCERPLFQVMTSSFLALVIPTYISRKRSAA